MSIARKDVISVLGPIDETTIAEILSIDPSQQELVEAWAWVNSDGALIDEGRHLPSGKIATLIELLAPPEDEP